jgi:hypothetical protein
LLKARIFKQKAKVLEDIMDILKVVLRIKAQKLKFLLVNDTTRRASPKLHPLIASMRGNPKLTENLS